MALFFLPPATFPPLLREPSVHSLAVPVRDWPRRRELPEDDHPAHDEGNPSPMVLGLGGYANTNTTATVTVLFSFSGSYDVGVAPATWLDNNFHVVVSMRNFPVEPFRPPTSPAGFVRVRLDSKGHPQILPVRRTTGSRSGR